MSLLIEDQDQPSAWTTKRRISVAILSFIIGATIFAIAYIGMQEKTGLGVVDQPALDWLVTHRDAYLTIVMTLVTTVTSPMVFIVAAFALAAVWALVKRELWRPFLLVGALGAAAVLFTGLKNLIQHARPPHVDMLAPFEIDYSFPSGHTIGIVVGLIVLGYLIHSRHGGARRVFGWTLFTVATVSLVAMSRLYLGYHWVTDVAGSIGLGLIILAIVIFLDVIVKRNLKD